MYLGVDGGGTKTAMCLMDQNGQVLAQVQAPSSYYFFEGIELVESVLRQGITAICAQAKLAPEEIEYAFFGLPGYGEVSADVPTLDAVPRRILGHDRYACNNDMVCGWAGSLAAVDGINIISGTGSMTYGEHEGKRARVGGWGELFGDEGSAYWIAIRGLATFSKMSDGRREPGPLHRILRNHLELDTDLDVIDVVLNRWHGARSEVAALSRLVVQAANQGDSCATRILVEAGVELAEIVDATRRRLDYPNDAEIPVSYSGGVFSAPAVLNAFDRQLSNLHDGYQLRDPLYAPPVGAAMYAAKLAGNPLNNLELRHLRLQSPELDSHLNS